MYMTEMTVKIVSSGEEAYVVLSARAHFWRKMYPCMSAANSEALELQIMTPNEKQLADLSQPVPT
jgi:hypothetical protein